MLYKLAVQMLMLRWLFRYGFSTFIMIFALALDVLLYLLQRVELKGSVSLWWGYGLKPHLTQKQVKRLLAQWRNLTYVAILPKFVCLHKFFLCIL